MNQDEKGNNFVKVGTVRLSYISAENRPESKCWAGSDVIRIQAYRDPNNNDSLHHGAEFPIENDKDLFEFIKSLIELRLESKSV